MTHTKISPMTRADLPGVRTVLEETQLFPVEMLDDMATPFLTGRDTSIWLTAQAEEGPLGFCYAVPEEMTDGTWNMLALAVRPLAHRRGVGRALVEALAEDLRARGHRLLLVDTSSDPALAPARAFYRALGMSEVALIPEFWGVGDDKVTYLARLR